MIIDLILDRKDGKEYNAKQFYFDVMHYGESGHGIANALDSGENKDVQFEIGRYIKTNEYNEEIVKYTNSVNWL